MKALPAIILVCLIAACTDDSASMSAADGRDTSVFDPLTGTIERAESVETTLMESAEDRRLQLEGVETD